MTKQGNLDVMLGGLFWVFIMALVGNLDENFWGYFKLFFIMPDVGNLYTYVGVIVGRKNHTSIGKQNELDWVFISYPRTVHVRGICRGLSLH